MRPSTQAWLGGRAGTMPGPLCMAGGLAPCLALCAWQARQAERLCPVQGLGQPMKYTGSWVEQWNARGISVCGLDLQGCGRSEGRRGLRFYVECFDDYVDDVLQLARCGGGGWSVCVCVWGGGRAGGGLAV
jgi:hypothetical protein